MGQGPVIGQQQALRVLVQTSHRGQAPFPKLRRQQVQHRALPAVLGGRQYPGGLMEHDIGEALRLHRLTVHGDGGGVRVQLFLCRPGGHAVYPHPSLTHQVLYLPPGPSTGPGQHLIQTLHIRTSRDFFCKNSIVPGKME